RAMIEDVREQGRAGRVSWVGIAKVERAGLSMLFGEDLRRYVWALRAEFREALNAMPSGHELARRMTTRIRRAQMPPTKKGSRRTCSHCKTSCTSCARRSAPRCGRETGSRFPRC